MFRQIISSDKLYKYITSAVILIIPLYPKFPFLRIPGTQVSVRIEDFFMAFVTIFLIIKILPRLKKVFSNQFELSIAQFIFVGLISLISGVFLTQTVIPHIGFLHWARRVEYFIPLFLGVLAIRDKENLNFYLKVLMLTTLIAFFYGFGQRYLNWPVIVTQNSEYAKGIALRWISGSHINSTFAGHYDLATYLVLILPIFISLFYVVKNIKTRIFLFITILSGLWLLLASISRISIASYLAGSAVALFIIKKNKAILVVMVFSLIFFSFSPDLKTRYLRIFDEARKRLGEISIIVYAQTEVPQLRKSTVLPTPTPPTLLEDRSSSIRLNVEWPRAIRSLAKNPPLGTGYSSITLATDNDYLRTLGETGILGFAAFGLVFVNLIKLVVSNFLIRGRDFPDVQKAFVAGTIGGTSGVLLNALFIDVFEASKIAIIFWLMIGILIGLLRKENSYE